MIEFENLCMNCMGELGEDHICPRCGYNDETDFQAPDALMYRAILQERYLVGRAMIVSGEGITYIGYDLELQNPIELREFFPYHTALRVGTQRVAARVDKEELFEEKLQEFLEHAKTLAHMREITAISQIYDIFEENGTAYTVSEWHESISLRYFVERSGGNLHWNAARQLFMPVLSALGSVHENSCGHYGLSPSSLRILPDGKMKITGFEIESARRSDSGLTADLISGCAAAEQYEDGTALDEATDVYGFAATLFFALTGSLPQDAQKRLHDSRLMIPTAILKNIPPHVITALANALQVEPEKRTKTFERLRAELSAAPTVMASIEETASIKRIVSQQPQQGRRVKNPRKRAPAFLWFVLPLILTLMILGSGIWLWYTKTMPVEADESSSVSEPISQIEPEQSSKPENSISPNAVLLPDLVGKNYEEILAEGNSDFRIMLGEMKFNDEFEEGLIFSQSPSYEIGKYGEKGDIIVVNVSKGESSIELPYIYGYTLAGASQMLSDLGFIPTKVDVYSDYLDRGYVVGYKDYYTGDKVSYGSQIIIEVSMGPKFD
ncbi:MAG: PASTA domain-containing protein [Clostridia bacterium]|nr:PASTA domain-containing protein [Clostridia bacterium]